MIDFGITEEAFWKLTHREYNALRKRWEAAEERINWRTALVTSWIANSIPRKHRRRPYKPADFMPKNIGKKRAETDGLQTYKKVAGVMQAFGGRKGRAETENQRRYRLDVIRRYRKWKESGAVGAMPMTDDPAEVTE